MKCLVAVLLAIVAFSACSSAPVTPPAEPAEPAEPTTGPQLPTPVSQPPSSIAVSDAVPTLEYLQELGIGEQAAECFITTIDPNGTGRVENAELFMEAFAACL